MWLPGGKEGAPSARAAFLMGSDGVLISRNTLMVREASRVSSHAVGAGRNFLRAAAFPPAYRRARKRISAGFLAPRLSPFPESFQKRAERRFLRRLEMAYFCVCAGGFQKISPLSAFCKRPTQISQYPRRTPPFFLGHSNTSICGFARPQGAFFSKKFDNPPPFVR